ncbi:MAG: GNAT family N-acetyltransferase [Actinomycetota bacterium]
MTSLRYGPGVNFERATKKDFLEIVDDLEDFWGAEGAARTRGYHHPLFVSEFDDTTLVLREDGRVVAYLFGFWSQAEPVGYIHLVGVRRSHQGRGVGRALYEEFESRARIRGCTALKAHTSPVNSSSIAFHRQMGFALIGEPNDEGVAVTPDHHARGDAVVTFRKELR